jgi:S1-C subfamily serine protease
MVPLAEAVIVTDVEKGTPAWDAGLRPGMLITHVERTAVQTPKGFRAAVAEKKGPVRLRLAGTDEATAAERVVPDRG